MDNKLDKTLLYKVQYPTIEKSHILAGYHPSMHPGHQLFVAIHMHMDMQLL